MSSAAKDICSVNDVFRCFSSFICLNSVWHCLDQSYAEQTVFGDGRSQLKCMNNSGEGCVGYFPDGMLRSSLTAKVIQLLEWNGVLTFALSQVYQKFEEAQARDALKAAHIDNLVTCHNCQLQVIDAISSFLLLIMFLSGWNVRECRGSHALPKLLQRNLPVFKHSIFRVFYLSSQRWNSLCGEIGHIPLKCSEVEKKGQTETRLTVEEAMTAARLRECKKCKAKWVRLGDVFSKSVIWMWIRFFKIEGCNKMTCACGAFICYMCRKVILLIDHFLVLIDIFSGYFKRKIRSFLSNCTLWPLQLWCVRLSFYILS